MKILLVEDDESIVAVVKRTLATYHYVMDTVTDGEQGWTYISTFEYDLIIMDVMLPKMDGISFCQKFRAEGYTTPILLLTSQNTSFDKVKGLDAGADDYVVKPFDVAELTARVRALLRRGSANPFPFLICGDLVLNPSTCEVRYQNQLLTLTTKEYELVELFLRNGQQVFSAEEILDRIWSSEEFPAEATVRSHIRRLRKKLVAAGAPQDFIATVHGRGYYLNPAAGSHANHNGNRQNDRTLDALLRSGGDNFLETKLLDTPEAEDVETSPSAPHTLGQAAIASARVPDDSQQAYLDVLNETWHNTQAKNAALAAELVQAVQKLREGTLGTTEQQQAHQIAHKLAGTLGIFGLEEATQAARVLEMSFQNSLHSQQANYLETQAIALSQKIEHTHQIEAIHLFQDWPSQDWPSQDRPSQDRPAQDQLFQNSTPLLWVIAPQTPWLEHLVAIAPQCGLRIAVSATPYIPPEHRPHVILLHVPDVTQARAWSNQTLSEQNLSNQSLSEQSLSEQIDALLIFAKQNLTFPTNIASPITSHISSNITPSISFGSPTDIPIMVLSRWIEPWERLEIVRRGGTLLLEETATPEEAIAAIQRLLPKAAEEMKVMLVDDDHTWLKMAPELLSPWGFKVSTLEDCQHLWTVLETVQPDALVLDVILPHINGIDLCQILRHDCRWQHLPILFLSVAIDPQTQQQAFAAGADDYLCKPVVGAELAYRIRHRLQRVKSSV